MLGKGCLASLLGVFVIAAHPLTAGEDLARVFGRCAGQYTAALEHSWLTGGGDSDGLEARQSEFHAILEAVASPEDDVALRALRIEARAAMRTLLGIAAFSLDAEKAERAQVRADVLLLTCENLLLKS